MNTLLQQVSQRSLIPVCVVLLFALAVWLRWDARPHTYFADELIPLAVVKHMDASGTLDTNWDHADWRGDYAGGFYDLRQYNFSSYMTALHGWRLLLRAAGFDAVPDLVLYRTASLFFQLLMLWLVFRVAACLEGVVAGLLAVAFLAVMPQAVVDGHYARPESLVMCLVALVMWLSCIGGRRWPDLVAAAVWGVAFACKFSFAPLAILAAAFTVYRWRSWWVLVAWMASFVLGVFLSAPYILLDPDGFLHGVDLLLNQYGPAASASSVLPSAGQLFPYLVSFFTWPVFLVSFFSLKGSGRFSRCLVIFSLLISAGYLLLFARQGVFFERNLSHLLPLWAVLFSLGCLSVSRLVLSTGLLVRLSPQLCARQSLPMMLGVVLLIAPLLLAINIVGYCFSGEERVAAWLQPQEEAVLRQWQARAVHTPRRQWDLTAVRSVPDGVLLRLPVQKIAEQAQWEQQVRASGFTEVARIVLPLGDLPYNQLQINHLPSAYSYYVRTMELR